MTCLPESETNPCRKPEAKPAQPEPFSDREIRICLQSEWNETVFSTERNIYE